MHRKKHIWCAVMIVFITVLDQITKFIAVKYLKGNGSVDFLPGIVRFTYSENTGMAFSMFSGARWVFVAVTVVVCAGILWYLFSNRAKHLWLYWSLGVVCAGGMGNLVDRALYGYVVDFIEPVFIDFAIFNIADCAVTLGAASLIAYLIFDLFKKEDKSVEQNIHL